VSKLNPKYIGPFEIIQIVSNVAVRLKLPTTMNIVNTFHVSRLKKISTSKAFPERSTFLRPDPVIVNRNDSCLNEWEVEEIMSKRTNRRRVEYLVKWKNCPMEDNSWEPVSNLANSTDLVRQYEQREIEQNSSHNKINNGRVSCTVEQNKPTVKRTYASVVSTGVTSNQSTAQNPTKLYSIRILTSITPTAPTNRIVRSLQCSARIKKGEGRRCRNKTLRSGMCQQHLQSQMNLNIRQSKVKSAGLGLFTGGRGIKKGERVTPYTGQVSETPISGNYVLQCTKKYFIDANSSKDVGGYVNECKRRDRERGECEGNNAKLTYDSRRKEANVIATKTIAPRKEVYLPYGTDYWSKIDNGRVKRKKE